MLYSIRMRASQGGSHENGGQHISGAERILTKDDLPKMAETLVKRALFHSKGEADFIRLTIDNIDENKIVTVPALKIETYDASSVKDGHNNACQFLQKNALVSEIATKKAMQFLIDLPQNMRGAALFDSQTGERLDNTGMRGIRVSKMDLKNPVQANKFLNDLGFKNIHLHEAIVLASKVLSAPHIVGELCWSDDPDYIIGYVSAKGCYHRITKMKPMYSNQGGRIFFVDNTRKDLNLNDIQQYLENQAVLVDFSIDNTDKKL